MRARAWLLRALAAGALVLAAGACGDDTTMTAPSMDLSQPVLDLSLPGGHACGATTCTGSCTVCVPLAGGVCGIPCNTATQATCTSGVCNAATADDGGAGVTFGGDCAAFNGFCG